MKHIYTPRGVCSEEISFDLTDGVISRVKIKGGCNGNLRGISTLLEGMRADEVVEKFSGIKCGFKKTSCPDQIACAIRSAQKEKK